MIGLTDRIRLRPLTVATKGSLLFLSSEEAAIRLVCPEVDHTRIPMGGEPIVGRLKTSRATGSETRHDGVASLAQSNREERR